VTKDEADIVRVAVKQLFEHLTGACTLRSPEVDELADGE
jgi:hypothetical protein